ncbi:MAG: rubrerythrin [Desulfobacterales bacterium]|nr:rubrerythrin [Desulfobacterales bacterium]
MPQFLSPYVGMTPARKLNNNELVRAVRMAQAAELEASHFYEAVADATDNEVAQRTFRDISNEEKVHQGEFMRLTEMFTGDEGQFLLQGAKEVDEKTVGIRNELNTSPRFNPLDPLGIMNAAARDISRMLAVVKR